MLSRRASHRRLGYPHFRSVSDRWSISFIMRTVSPQAPTRLIQQKNLLGGTDVWTVTRSKAGQPHRARRVHVDEKRLGFASALMVVVENGRRAAEANEVPKLAYCPKCGHRGPTATDFGTRVMRGVRKAQSWCRGCRAQHLESHTSSTNAQADFVFVP